MGDPVDRPSSRFGWIMSDSESGKDQNRLAVLQLDPEDHSEFAVRGREPQLHTIRKCRSIRPFLLACEKPLDRHPCLFELPASRTRHLFPGLARPPQVLSEGSVIE